MDNNREFFLSLAKQGHRLPLGSDLVLGEKPDSETIKHNGKMLGQVIEEAARRWNTPIAVPLMDLSVEKEWLLSSLGIPSAKIPTYHFCDEVPTEIPDDMPVTSRIKANIEAIKYIVEETELFPCGMSIGPFSLMTKFITDPITPVFLAGMGERNAEVERVEKTLYLAIKVILRSISLQIDAGARAIIVCEPAANTVFFSPNQLASGTDTFDRYVIELNHRVRELLRGHSADLIFHDCGELTDSMVQKFVTLDPVMISFGSSRKLWEDAKLVPKNIVIYGNLPTKKFYSDKEMSVETVMNQTRELLAKMVASGHPFILGSECDILSVPGREKTIKEKVEAFLKI